METIATIIIFAALLLASSLIFAPAIFVGGGHAQRVLRLDPETRFGSFMLHPVTVIAITMVLMAAIIIAGVASAEAVYPGYIEWSA